MDLSEYQKLAGRTLLDLPDFRITPADVMLSWNTIGLVGEAGEVAELVKKGIFHQQGVDYPKLAKELGDVLWYLAAICSHCHWDLADIAKMNIEKLQARFPNGYESARTTNREGNAA